VDLIPHAHPAGAGEDHVQLEEIVAVGFHDPQAAHGAAQRIALTEVDDGISLGHEQRLLSAISIRIKKVKFNRNRRTAKINRLKIRGSRREDSRNLNH
jgi:hypothetical protein